ncbi:hypothetical protein IWX75_002302 [Arthrobacter sp. CAN_A6]|uniref:hypothetical protein n=1 Tax=Arthrobacter sp. CAN_A6 TaxID=2787721 RepID=UPI0018C9B12B
MRLPSTAVCAAAVVLLATGCGGGTVSDSAPAINMPPPPTVLDTVQPDDAGTGAPETVDAAPGSAPVPDPADSCVMVAGGVSSILLAPMSLRSHSDPTALAALRNQILELREKVPGELHGNFTVLAAAVEVPPRGSGEFDEPGFREALRPVQDWLGAHCAEQASQ